MLAQQKPKTNNGFRTPKAEQPKDNHNFLKPCEFPTRDYMRRATTQMPAAAFGLIETHRKA